MEENDTRTNGLILEHTPGVYYEMEKMVHGLPINRFDRLNGIRRLDLGSP